MSTRTSAQALAETTSALLRDHDVPSLLVQLLRDVSAFVPADAAAVLVRDPHGELELLSATSHRAAELEVFQAQTDEGPCVDVIAAVKQVSEVGPAAVVARWPRIGPQIVAAGFGTVHAFPLRWRDQAVGGLNLFSGGSVELGDDARELAQAFADVATLALVQPQRLQERELASNLVRALEGRVVIEQAKGVLAHHLGVDLSDAYDELLRRADEDGRNVTETAEAVIRAAQRR
ncbi:GAF and ANTAR domain-containing protein [Antribacter gilvus]|uniref:GAF and ANTAR domain-containing protein n=1 Tax=Antribacter gilvus TaxID=2304675 RepID=UPI000F78376C|nr:GAF and ANTAR domain-containing protein [Antribacter gilvus]